MSPIKRFNLLSKIKRTAAVRFCRCFFLFAVFSSFLLYGFSQGGQEEKQAKPQVHKKVFFLSEDGKLYTARDLPVYLCVSSGPGGQESRLPVDKGTGPGSLLLKEGLNLLRQEGTGITYQVYADGTPPVTQPDFSPAPKYVKEKNVYFGKGLTIKLIPTDTLSGAQGTFLSLNGKAFQPIVGPFPGFAADAENSLRYYSVDRVGNMEEPQELIFYLDVTPPRTHLKIEPGQPSNDQKLTARRAIKSFSGGPGGRFFKKAPLAAGGINILSPRAVLSLMAEDNLSGVKSVYYRLDDAKERKYTGAVETRNLTDGEHTLRYFAVDNVGNVGETGSYNFYCDKIAPRISLSVEGEKSRVGETLYVPPGSKIELEARDNKAGLAMILYRLDENEETIYPGPFTLPMRGGLHHIAYFAVDNVGNQSPQQIKKIYLDLIPPVCEWFVTGLYFVDKETLMINRDNRLSLVATDLEAGVKEIKYRVNREEETDYTGPLSFREDGVYRVAYFAVDRVGNREEERFLTLAVDNSPGRVGFFAPPVRHLRQWVVTQKGDVTGPPGQPFYLVLSMSVGDNVQSFLLDMKKLSAGMDQPVSFEKEGIQYLRLAMGKKEEVYRVSIDATPPETRLLFSGAQKYDHAGKLYFGPGLALDFARRDLPRELGSGCRKTMVSIDGVPFFTFKDPVKIFHIEKEYSCRYYSVDHVGNVEPPREIRFIVDTTPPHTVHGLEGTTYGDILSCHSIITLTASDNLSGVRAIYYRFDNRDEKIYKGSLTGDLLRILSEGKHTLHYFASDHVGNREEAHRYSFYLDKAAPVVNFVLLGDQFTRDGQLYVFPRARISLAAAKKPAGIKTIRWRIGDLTEQEYTSPFILVRESGKHIVSYYAVDRAGNRGRRQTKTLFLDLTPPETEVRWSEPVFKNQGRLFTGPRTEIELKAGDSLSGPGDVYCRIDGGIFKPYSQPLRITKQGFHTLEYYAKDRVNNKEKTKKSVFYLDREPPRVKITYNIAPQRIVENGVPVFPKNVLIDLSAEDSHTEVDRLTYQLNDGLEVLYRNPLSKFKTGKFYTLKAFAVDRVGNTGTAELTFRVE